jgi:hypothetical protein
MDRHEIARIGRNQYPALRGPATAEFRDKPTVGRIFIKIQFRRLRANGPPGKANAFVVGAVLGLEIRVNLFLVRVLVSEGCVNLRER